MIKLWDAIAICTKFLECNKRVTRCKGDCYKCKLEYSDSQLREAIKVLLKQIQKDGAE